MVKAIICFNWQILNRGFVLGVGQDFEAIVRRDSTSVMSLSPQMFTNYDSVFQDRLSRIHNNSQTTWNLQEQLREHSERITNLESKTGDHEARLVDCNRAIEETTIDVGSLKRQLEEMNRIAELNARWMQSIEHELTLRNVTLADLEEYVRQQEFSSFDGQLLWKITEFSRRKNEAVSGQKVSFYSPCFFTSRYGYKMCARIYLNGDGAGRGTHISVFFAFCQVNMMPHSAGHLARRSPSCYWIKILCRTLPPPSYLIQTAIPSKDALCSARWRS